jgi:hypothetical protein
MQETQMPRVLRPGFRFLTALSMSHAQRDFCIGESVAGVILAWLLTHIIYSLHFPLSG